MRAKLTQAAVAASLGVSEVSVSSWERGTKAPVEENLEQLAQLYAVPVAELRYGEGAAMSRGRVLQEPAAEYSPSPAMRRRLPPKAYAVAYDYLERMRKAGATEEQIDMAEQLMSNDTFAILNARERRELTEEELVAKIHADWDVIQYALRKEGMKL